MRSGSPGGRQSIKVEEGTIIRHKGGVSSRSDIRNNEYISFVGLKVIVPQPPQQKRTPERVECLPAEERHRNVPGGTRTHEDHRE